MRLVVSAVGVAIFCLPHVTCALKTGQHSIALEDPTLASEGPAAAVDNVTEENAMEDLAAAAAWTAISDVEPVTNITVEAVQELVAKRGISEKEAKDWLTRKAINDHHTAVLKRKAEEAEWAKAYPKEAARINAKMIAQKKKQRFPVPPPPPNCTHSMLTKGANGSAVRVVVSLATTGTAERLLYLKRAIDSLWYNQTMKPDRIILTFPTVFERKQQRITIPAYVKEWEREIPALTIQQMEDYGPTTKLLGGLNLEKDPETVILVVDDDVQYRNYTIERLVCWMLDPPVPEEVATCFAGEMPCPLAGHARWRPADRFFGFGRGVGGVAYRVRYFDDFVWKIKDPDVPKSCFVNDDVWIGGAMKKASGVLPYIVRFHGNSVIRHGSCNGLACGFENDSSTIANNHHFKATGVDMKKDCEEYFDRFCCPEMCVGGRYVKKNRGFEPKPMTLWGPTEGEARAKAAAAAADGENPRLLAAKDTSEDDDDEPSDQEDMPDMEDVSGEYVDISNDLQTELEQLMTAQ